MMVLVVFPGRLAAEADTAKADRSHSRIAMVR
jgi:hypothetical protein